MKSGHSRQLGWPFFLGCPGVVLRNTAGVLASLRRRGPLTPAAPDVGPNGSLTPH